jgi:hypothetical protein
MDLAQKNAVLRRRCVTYIKARHPNNPHSLRSDYAAKVRGVASKERRTLKTLSGLREVVFN